MAADGSPPPPDRAQLLGYIEDMLLEMAGLAAGAGETALAASLALTAIQAGAARGSPAPPS